MKNNYENSKNLIFRAYKYRIYPNNRQATLLRKHFGCVRFVYNWGLAKKNEHYAQNKETLNHYGLTALLAGDLKKENPWLNDVTAQSLQMALRNLDNAYTNFFRKKSDFPKFKSRHKSKRSCQFPQKIKLNASDHKVYIPKCKWMQIALDKREIKGKIKTCTVSMDKCEKFYISILTEDETEFPKQKKIVKSKTIGLDLGIKTFCVASDGRQFDFKIPKWQKTDIKFQQRSLSRKIKKSGNWEAQKLVIAKKWQKIVNQRNDFQHKLSYRLTHDNQVTSIVIEDLNVAGMMKNHSLAGSIGDASWSEFGRMLSYKCDWTGVNLLKIGRFDPSSKMCSNCGHIKKDLTLKDRKWQCEKCHAKHDRDLNAAKNIKNFGLQRQNLVGVSPELKLVETSNVDLKNVARRSSRSTSPVKQEVSSFGGNARA